MYEIRITPLVGVRFHFTFYLKYIKQHFIIGVTDAIEPMSFTPLGHIRYQILS